LASSAAPGNSQIAYNDTHVTLPASTALQAGYAKHVKSTGEFERGLSNFALGSNPVSQMSS